MSTSRKSETKRLKSLGDIEPVSIRDIWKSESGKFTPWLASTENIARLSRAIGCQLRVDHTEKRVGPFRADIVCCDCSSGARVVIENQLKRSDHSHLGQLLTYATDLEADTVVWIAPEFVAGHLRVIRWLNELGASRRFMAVRLSVSRLRGSALLKHTFPQFDLVDNSLYSKTPNAKTRTGQRQDKLAKTQHAYWQSFLSRASVKDLTAGANFPKAVARGNVRFTVAGKDLWITTYVATSSGQNRGVPRCEGKAQGRLAKIAESWACGPQLSVPLLSIRRS